MLALLVQTAGLAASVCAGLVFLLAAVAKLRHRQLLPGVIANYRLLPDALVTPAAILLPVAELAIGVALLAGSRPLAPVAAIALLLVFAGAIAVNIRRGRTQIDCGCGHDGLRQGLHWPLVVRNVVLAGALALRLPDGEAMAASEIMVAAMSGIVLFMLILFFNALNALPGRIPAGLKR